MSYLFNIRGVDAAADKLAQADIHTARQLWARAGARRKLVGNVKTEVAQVADECGIEWETLVALLAALSVDQSRTRRVPSRAALGRYWRKGSRRRIPALLAQWIVLHRPRRWLNLALPFAALILVTLTLRATGAFAQLPAPWGLSEKSLVSTRELKGGRALRDDDLVPARLPPRHDYFHDTAELVGLVPARDLPPRTPLRHRDVLRPQVVAKVDLNSGDTPDPNALQLQWSPYDPAAATLLAQVQCCKLAHPVKAGSVVPRPAAQPAATPARPDH